MKGEGFCSTDPPYKEFGFWGRLCLSLQIPNNVTNRKRVQNILSLDFTAEEVTTSQKLYCVCKQHNSEDQPYAQCAKCEDWFHPRCEGFQSITDIETQDISWTVDVLCNDFRDLQKSLDNWVVENHSLPCSMSHRTRAAARDGLLISLMSDDEIQSMVHSRNIHNTSSAYHTTTTPPISPQVVTIFCLDYNIVHSRNIHNTSSAYHTTTLSICILQKLEGFNRYQAEEAFCKHDPFTGELVNAEALKLKGEGFCSTDPPYKEFGFWGRLCLSLQIPNNVTNRKRVQNILSLDFTAEEVTTSQKLYCVCKQHNSEDQPYAQCAKCEDWFHPRCEGFQSITDIESMVHSRNIHNTSSAYHTTTVEHCAQLKHPQHFFCLSHNY
ncbi:hypothetical protein DNTS_005338, partial [Danionella cerebrum]